MAEVEAAPAPVKATATRDTVLEQRMLEAVIADRNDQPRNQQLQVGPSSVGFCRELLRASLFEAETMMEPETSWATAAHVGSVMGEALEGIFGRRLGALEQQRVTATLTQLGISLSGAIDLLFMDENIISDLKSNDDMGGILYDLDKNADLIASLLTLFRNGELYRKHIDTVDGGYELTDVLLRKFSKLHYYVQVAIYVTGAMQSGVLSAGAEGRLVFYDRGGNYQEFVALVISAEEIAMFFEIAQQRVLQVVQAQDAYEATNGNPAVIAPLRDMTPSFCFSPKVMCARRMHCWDGSDWTADTELRGAEVTSAAERYKEGRRLAKLGEGMKKGAREELKGVEGRLPDGTMITWTGGGRAINVTDTVQPAAKPKGSKGEQLVEAVKEAQIPVIPGVLITAEADVIVQASEMTEEEDAHLARLRDLQRSVAAERTARGRITSAAKTVFEAEERETYGGLSFHDHLEFNVDPIARPKMKKERNAALVERQQAALREAGL